MSQKQLAIHSLHDADACTFAVRPYTVPFIDPELLRVLRFAISCELQLEMALQSPQQSTSAQKSSLVDASYVICRELLNVKTCIMNNQIGLRQNGLALPAFRLMLC